MSEREDPGLLDKLVGLLAQAMDALGLNGARLRWRWSQRRQDLGEKKLRSSLFLRSARGRHKMCPSCRALVPRSARTCPECGASLASVRGPGVGRLIANLLPGASAVTSLLLLANGFWFAVMMMAQMKAGSSGGLLSHFSGELLVRFGSGLSRYVTAVGGGGEWWRLITPIFLHGGLLHFFFNSYVLLQLGPVVQEIYGPKRFWVIYLCCGIAGSATSQLPRFVNTVGASGAIMGLMGLLLVYGWRHGGAFGNTLKSSMIRFGLYILVFSLFFPNIDHLNHAGGFACGALLAAIVPAGTFRSRTTVTVWEAMATGGVLLVLFAFFQVALHARQ